MEQRTSALIERLKSLESKEQLETEVIEEVAQCKSSLQAKGYRFYEEDRTDEIAGGQGILGKDVSETRYMEEIGHIKRGLTEDSWVQSIDEPVRFNDIRDAVMDVQFNLEL